MHKTKRDTNSLKFTFHARDTPKSFLFVLQSKKSFIRLDKKALTRLKICQRINCLQLIRSEKKLAIIF